MDDEEPQSSIPPSDTDSERTTKKVNYRIQRQGSVRKSTSYALHPTERGFISLKARGLRDQVDPNDPATQPSEVRIIKPGKN